MEPVVGEVGRKDKWPCHEIIPFLKGRALKKSLDTAGDPQMSRAVGSYESICRAGSHFHKAERHTAWSLREWNVMVRCGGACLCSVHLLLH